MCTKLGQGAYGCVSQVEIAGKSRAVKEGKLGPLEVTVLSCGSKSVPTLVCDHDSSPSLKGRVTMKLAPGKIDTNKRGALNLFKGLFVALIDINIKCRERGIIGPDEKIIHRDLKRANIGYSRKGVLKILDWGSATVDGLPSAIEASSSKSGGGRAKKVRVYSPAGTAGSIPPESYFKENPITDKVDSWALGIMLYQILSGKPHPLPFENGTIISLAINGMAEFPDTDEFRAIRDSEFVTKTRADNISAFQKGLDDVPRDESLPAELYEVMKGLLKIDPRERLSIEEGLLLLNSAELSSKSPISSGRSVESTTMSSSGKISGEVSEEEDYSDNFEPLTIATGPASS